MPRKMQKKTRNNLKPTANHTNPRRVALTVLHKVAAEGAFANIALNNELNRAELSPRDRGLATELVYGTLRRQGSLDYILELFLTKPLKKLPLWILLILRMGLYQMRYMDKIPDSAAINESVKLAKKFGHQGTAGLVNGTLRSICRQPEKIIFPNPEEDPAAYISAYHSHPLWLAERWLKEYGFEDTVKLCEYNNSSPELALRCNTLKADPAEIIKNLQTAGIKAVQGKFAAESILVNGAEGSLLNQYIAEGLVYPQHQSSLLPPLALAPRAGSRVIDACAAPGGKTTHLAQLMNNSGEIRAFDVFAHKVELIRDNCRRLGIDIVTAAEADSRNLPEELNDWADYVLVDAPCSGLGVLRIRPDARWQKTPESIGELAAVSYDILKCAARKVKVGGYILFSTCTVTHEENQELAEKFLAEHKNFRPAVIDKMPKMIYENAWAWQVLPQKHGIDGFFLAKFQRVE